MADGLQEPAPKRWPAILVLVGISGLLPIPAIQRAHELAEELTWTLRGLVQPARRSARAADSTPPAAAADPRVAELLASLRQSVLPPKARGWQRDGRFGVVPLGTADGLELTLMPPAAVAPGEPAFYGEQLVGFTAARSNGSIRLERVTKSGTRLSACAGAPGRREARFLALGDGSTALRVAYADGGVELHEGDFAFALDPPSPRGGAANRVIDAAVLGRLVRGDLPEGAEREEWRIEPLRPLERLAEVAIRFPPGLPLPSDTDLYPCASELLAHSVVDSRRAFARLCDGREQGIVPGSAVASEGYLLGRVVRAGFGHALVQTVRDPGFRQRALALVEGTVLAFELEVVRAHGSTIEVRPPVGLAWEGALVVTAASADGTPEGLLIGALTEKNGRCELVATPEPVGRVVAWRPAGAWSAAP